MKSGLKWENEGMERISRKGNEERNDQHLYLYETTIIVVSRNPHMSVLHVNPFTTLGSFIPISAKGYLGQVKSRVNGMKGATNHAMLTLCVEARVSY